eukprot:EC798166.1.p2 GENE.EC798166.1~~EC798166.1.p2  ORF type:complete len:229 (+),score=60.42 EC798166.1:20-706(+)
MSTTDRELRIGVAGGHGTLMRFLTGYACLRKAQPELLRDRDLKFYLFPLGSYNGLPAVMSAYDGWYGRSLVAPLQFETETLPLLEVDLEAIRQDMLRPDDAPDALLEFETDLKITKSVIHHHSEPGLIIGNEIRLAAQHEGLKFMAERSKLFEVPAMLTHNLVQSYFRDAHYTLDVCICNPGMRAHGSRPRSSRQGLLLHSLLPASGARRVPRCHAAKDARRHGKLAE